MSRRRAVMGVSAVAGAVVVLVVALSSITQATHSPANKAWVAASAMEIMRTQLGVGSQDATEVVLAETRAKYSNPTDLRISVTSECALWTNTATTGDDDSESKARVEYWVTIDGKRVRVTDGSEPADNTSKDPDVQAGPGKVVFCNRAARMKTENIEAMGAGTDSDTEDDIIIRSYNRSRTANAFNWGALDIGRTYDDVVTPNGKGTLLIQLHARLAAEVADSDTSDNNNAINSPAAMAAVGKRTMFIEPVKMANDVSF